MDARRLVLTPDAALILAAVGGWLASLVVRVMHPDAAALVGVDPIMLLIVSYWFTQRSKSKAGGS